MGAEVFSWHQNVRLVKMQFHTRERLLARGGRAFHFGLRHLWSMLLDVGSATWRYSAFTRRYRV
jgi:hypothetical protein